MSSAIQDRCERAQAEFVQHISGMNSLDTASSLWTGLTTLRKLFLTRLHRDVEAEFGVDSALVPATTGETIREMHHAAEEIEAYSLVLVIDEVCAADTPKGMSIGFAIGCCDCGLATKPIQTSLCACGATISRAMDYGGASFRRSWSKPFLKRGRRG